MLLAHSAHWINYLLYAMPVLVIAALVMVELIRPRRDQGEGPDE